MQGFQFSSICHSLNDSIFVGCGIAMFFLQGGDSACKNGTPPRVPSHPGGAHQSHKVARLCPLCSRSAQEGGFGVGQLKLNNDSCLRTFWRRSTKIQ